MIKSHYKSRQISIIDISIYAKPDIGTVVSCKLLQMQQIMGQGGSKHTTV